MKMNKTVGLTLLLVGVFAAGLFLGRTTMPGRPAPAAPSPFSRVYLP